MAHLPPRVPNMTPNWPDFSLHQKIENLTPTATAGADNPLWEDAFLDLSSKRGSHRRSMSDSIAFLETPMVEECRRLSTGPDQFERFDEEQIMSMFNDDIVDHNMSCSNPSSPSDYINDNEDKSMNKTRSNDQQMQQLKSEHEEVESSCKSDEQEAAAHNANTENSCEMVSDPKRIKRILANRQSAQRSRVRKLQYVSELERSVSTLQAEVSVLSPRVAFLDHQRLILNVDNSALRQRIAALAQDKLFKDAHQEALKLEIERLRQIYYQQNLKKMEENGNSTTQLPLADSSAPEMKVQLVN